MRHLAPRLRSRWVSLLAGAAAFALLMWDTRAVAETTNEGPAAQTTLDRAVIRWFAPETGGPARPHFIFERELAFEARLESLADPDPEPRPYHDRHVHAAIDRHIAESLLAALPILPPPSGDTIARRAGDARAILEQRVQGPQRLLDAAKAEGIGADDLSSLFERQARASLYLDRMVAPMLNPTDLELRDLFRTGATPFKELSFEQAAPALTRWYVGQRLSQAIEAFFQNARARVVIVVARRAT